MHRGQDWDTKMYKHEKYFCAIYELPFKDLLSRGWFWHSAIILSLCWLFFYLIFLIDYSPISFSLVLVQSLSRVWLFVTPWIAAHQASLSITSSRSSLRFTAIESVMPSSHLILYRPLLLLPPIPPSVRVFSNESTLRMRQPKYWSFSFSIIPSIKNPRVDLLQNGLVGSPCSPRDSQESSPTPQFKHINSSALSLHSSTLISIHDYWKNHSLD